MNGSPPRVGDVARFTRCRTVEKPPWDVCCGLGGAGRAVEYDAAAATPAQAHDARGRFVTVGYDAGSVARTRAHPPAHTPTPTAGRASMMVAGAQYGREIA